MPKVPSLDYKYEIFPLKYKYVSIKSLGIKSKVIDFEEIKLEVRTWNIL
jgi:hypothetical protein